MICDVKNFDRMLADGRLQQRDWGDGETACLMSSLIPGAEKIEDCAAKGWPVWLAEVFVHLFDADPSDDFAWGRKLRDAIEAAVKRNADLAEGGPVWRAVRLNAILPIAADAVGEGDEHWRVQCRQAVQWSLDNGGARAAGAARAVGAAGAARAVGAAGATGATGAAWAAWAAGATGAAWAAGDAEAAGATGAAWAAGDAEAAANERILTELCRALREEE